MLDRMLQEKSTLISICTEQIIHAQLDKDISIKDFLKSAFIPLYELEAKMNEIYAKAADGNMTSLSLASQYQDELERADFYLIDTHIEQEIVKNEFTC